MKPTNDATTAAKELFAERLKDKLAEYDIKQNALAEDLGVSESTVGKWILGKSMPRTMGMVEKIADRLHVGKSYFLEEKPTPVKEELSGHERQHLELYRALDDNAGVNLKTAQLILGHASHDVTRRVYTHKTIQQLIDAIDSI